MQIVIKLFIILIVFLLAACSQHQPAPISSRTTISSSQGLEFHHVRTGETLYSIAWQYDLDYRYLSKINGIGSDYLIFPGQRLALSSAASKALPSTKPPAEKSSASAGRVVDPSKNNQGSTVNRSNKKTIVPEIKLPKTTPLSMIAWQWPAKGRVITNFHGGQSAGKGIDITGKKGEAVVAAGSGKVVYAGNGIRGYGNLVIIRHSAEYLSAYAHNDKISVREGEQVSGGQRIAELGTTGVSAKNRAVLHFQIRKNGKPIDPLRLLPKRNI